MTRNYLNFSVFAILVVALMFGMYFLFTGRGLRVLIHSAGLFDNRTAIEQLNAQYAARDDVPSIALKGYDLSRVIEERYLSGFYSRHKIAFDLRKDAGLDWTAEYRDKKKASPIPDQMFVALAGKEIRRN